MKHEIPIFQTGEGFFDFLFSKLRLAQKEILIATYVVRPDSIGRVFLDILKDRARAGVKVRLIYDTLESRGFSEVHEKELRESGVEVFAFRKWNTFLFRHPIAFLYRNHSRFFMIDREWFLLGSMSIAEVYEKREDLMMAFPYPPAEYFLACFDYMTQLALEDRPPAPSLVIDAPPSFLAPGVRILWSGPRPYEQQIYPHLLRLVREAKERIVIVTAFFFPTVQLAEELILASERGVKVSIITPLRTDKGKYDHLRALPLISLTAKGIAWYGIPHYFHEKFVVADERWITGSANIDIIGLLRDYEINIEGAGGYVLASLERIAASLVKDQTAITDYPVPFMFKSFHRFFYRLVEFFFVPR